MGWNAFATRDSERLPVDWHLRSKLRPEILDAELNEAFKAARNRVKRTAGSVDGWLFLGGLDCSLCAEMLEKATGIDAWGEPLTPDEVKRIYEEADWNFAYPVEDGWAYHSARQFLETCAAHALGIEFSY